MDNLTTLIIPIMNMRYLYISLCLLQFLSSESCSCQCIRSFSSLVKFIPKYFIVFDATVNGIVFLISFSNVSLLVYRNATVFSMLIFCPANSLNLFISSKSFLVESLGFSIYSIISSANNDSSASSLHQTCGSEGGMTNTAPHCLGYCGWFKVSQLICLLLLSSLLFF